MSIEEEQKQIQDKKEIVHLQMPGCEDSHMGKDISVNRENSH